MRLGAALQVTLGPVVAALAVAGCGGSGGGLAGPQRAAASSAAANPSVAVTAGVPTGTPNLQDLQQCSRVLAQLGQSFATDIAAHISDPAALAGAYAKVKADFDASSTGLSARAKAAGDAYLDDLQRVIQDSQSQNLSALQADEGKLATDAEALATACGE